MEFPQIEPLSPNARQHIYGWDACDYRHLDWLVMTGRVSSHQDNRVPAEELVRVKEKESPPSEPGYGPQSDPNYGTGPSLESAPVRDSDLLVDKPDSGKSVRPMPEPRQFPMRESSRKSHGAEQWTYNSPSRPLYRCPTCHKIVNSKSELKYVARAQQGSLLSIIGSIIYATTSHFIASLQIVIKRKALARSTT